MKYIYQDFNMVFNSFSIIISLYNKCKYIERALLSIINQNYKYFEVIIIDASSTDGSYEIAVKFAKYNKEIKIIRQMNLGYSFAKNYGASIANYENITFLDADDEWNIDFLNEVNILINTYPEAKAFVTGHNHFFDIDKIFPIVYPNENSTGYIDDYLQRRINGWAPHTSSTVFNKEFFLKSGGFPSTVFSNQMKKSWLINCSEEIIATFNWLCPGQRSVEVKNTIFQIPSKLVLINDISVELPGCPAEDQFIFDHFGFNYKYAFTKKISSTYFLNIPDQTILRIKNKNFGRFYPNLIQIDKYLQNYKITDPIKYLKLIKYYRFMTIGLFSELIFNPDLRNLINSNYKIFEKWGSSIYFLAFLNLIFARSKRKIKYLLSNVLQ
jgi:glycosyltransferase involved in cell wall biosynthesis